MTGAPGPGATGPGATPQARSPGDPAHLAERLAHARALARRGRLDRAELELAQLCELCSREGVPADLHAMVRNHLTEVQWAQGHPADVERTCAGTVSLMREALHDEARPAQERARASVELALTLVRLATLRLATGAETGAHLLADRAIGEVLRRALVLWERSMPAEDSPASQLSRMAMTLMRAGLAGHAERVLRLELGERERTGQPARRVSRCRIHLGQALLVQGRVAEAEIQLARALDERTQARDPIEAVLKARCWYAMGLLAHNKAEQAERVLLEGLGQLGALEDNPSARAALRYSLARVHFETGRVDEAVAILRKGMEDLERGSADARSLSTRQHRLLTLLQAPDGGTQLLRLLGAAETAGLNPGALEQLRREATPRDNSLSDEGARTLQGLDLGDLDRLLPDPGA